MRVREPPVKTWIIFAVLLALSYLKLEWVTGAVAFGTFLQVQFLREEVMALRRLAEPDVNPDGRR